jgi:membrane-associated phospholipid phosphatase
MLAYYYAIVNNIRAKKCVNCLLLNMNSCRSLKTIAIVLLCLAFFNVNAQVVDTTKKNLVDTLKKDLFTAPDTVKKLHSNPLSLIPPAALIAYGASSFFIHPVRNLDYYIHGRIERSAPTFNSKAESYFLFTPIAMAYGLNAVGISAKNTFIDRTALLGLSGGFLAITELSLKHVTHRLRPNGVDYYSFPSGHTGAAFLGAEFLAQEYSEKSPVFTVIGYGFAVTTGIFRMYNRDHWFSDVVAGAGFGILSTKAAYLVYPYIRNALTHTDKKGRKAMLMPSYQDGAAGLSFAMQL